MLKVKSGDVDRLGLLFDRYHRVLYSFFYRFTSSKMVSEDLVQNVFMRMLKYKHTFTGEGKFTTWMYHLARNVYADYYRKDSRLGFSDDFTTVENSLHNSYNLEEQTKKDEEIQLLQKALNQLSPDKKEVLILSRYQDLKYKEIADILGCSEAAVKVKVFRAMQDLKNIYTQLERQEI
ncbi:RNA polymerase sigma factor [Adhaeribacter arboris]|uniref:RNA polymerase sigma factor n=2 Tax=Adhaeribacter arboris TaxID=2072846 RepID=A0A2T2YPD9_9BACT|nr:RNA polymerase sigma factor [Adhaeribacter arboris]